MQYVDGFVTAVPSDNRDEFRKHAETAAAVVKEHGALSVVECWGDDVPGGRHTSFRMAVRCREDETVVFSWITWPSRAFRDAAMESLAADPRMRSDVNPPPYDDGRVIFGGFEVIVAS